MIRSCRDEQRQDVAAFADGLTDWIRGENSIDGQAAAQIVAETILMLKAAHTEGGKP